MAELRLSVAGHGVGFVEQGEGDAEAGVGGLGSGDGLEEQVERARRCCDGLHLRGDVGEDAALRGDGVALADVVDQAQQRGDGLEALSADGVDADDGVAGAEQQAVEDAGGDAERDRRWGGWAGGGWRGGRGGRRWCGSG